MSAENIKWRVNRAVRKSNLPAPARLIMLVLSDMADAKTGTIPESKNLSLRDIARETGLGESTVKAQLLNLEHLGWVLRSRPEAGDRARHVSTGYQLRVGSEGIERAPLKRKPRARSKPSETDFEGQEQAPAEGQEQAPENESEGQELAVRGPGDSSPRAISWPSYIKDNDLNDPYDLKAAADAAHRDADALFEADPPVPKSETVNQRANRLARVYTGRIQLSNHPAVTKIIIQAIQATGSDDQPLYTDQQITDALNKLADDDWTVTVNTLRIALKNSSRPATGKPAVSHQGFQNPSQSAYGPPKRGNR